MTMFSKFISYMAADTGKLEQVYSLLKLIQIVKISGHMLSRSSHKMYMLYHCIWGGPYLPKGKLSFHGCCVGVNL